jgi:hypothetical protein
MHVSRRNAHDVEAVAVLELEQLIWSAPDRIYDAIEEDAVREIDASPAVRARIVEALPSQEVLCALRTLGSSQEDARERPLGTVKMAALLATRDG